MTNPIVSMAWKHSRYLLRSLGVDLRRWTPRNDFGLRVARALSKAGVDAVLDIGANTGQFARSIRNYGYRGNIISIEPLAHAHKLLRQAAEQDPLWIVPDPLAIGSESGRVLLNVSKNWVSSSLLPINRLHVNAAPDSQVIGTESVACVTLDELTARYPNSKGYFLKIDVQGFEGEVLKGGGKTLAACAGILCETSLYPLYEGGVDWLNILTICRTAGLDLWCIEPGFSHPDTGQQFQVDLLMLRKQHITSL
jgi:FkbM family methyltransferase